MGTCSSEGKSNGVEGSISSSSVSCPSTRLHPGLFTSGTAILWSPSCIYHVCCQIFLLRNISGGIKFLRCFSPHSHRFCFWLIFFMWLMCILRPLSFFWWGCSLEEKMYLFFKLVASGIIRLCPASQFCEEFEYVYSKYFRIGQFAWVLQALASHYTRDFELFLGLCSVCIVLKSWEVACCFICLVGALLGECTGKAKAIKKMNGFLSQPAQRWWGVWIGAVPRVASLSSSVGSWQTCLQKYLWQLKRDLHSEAMWAWVFHQRLSTQPASQ